MGGGRDSASTSQRGSKIPSIKVRICRVLGSVIHYIAQKWGGVVKQAFDGNSLELEHCSLVSRRMRRSSVSNVEILWTKGRPQI